MSALAPHTLPTRRGLPWGRLLLAALALGLLLVGIGLYGAIDRLPGLPFSLVVDGETVAQSIDFSQLDSGQRVALVCAVLLTLLIVVTVVLVVVPLTLMVVLVAVLLAVLAAVGAPLLALLLVLAIVAAPFLLLLGVGARLLRAPAAPRSPSATIDA